MMFDAIRQRAETGVARGAESLAAVLHAQGLHAEAHADRVTIQGNGLIAREFGSLTRGAQPAIAPIVRAHTREIVRLISAEIGNTK